MKRGGRKKGIVVLTKEKKLDLEELVKVETDIKKMAEKLGVSVPFLITELQRGSINPKVRPCDRKSYNHNRSQARVFGRTLARYGLPDYLIEDFVKWYTKKKDELDRKNGRNQ